MNKVNISFQSGVFKEVIAVKNEKISLKELQELAAKFIQKIYSKYGFDNILSDYLLLYRHDNNSANILQLITTSNDISDGMLIEIIIGSSSFHQRLLMCRHALCVHSYKSPTFCDFCGELLFGLVKQGLKCQGCKLNYHKRCVSKIPNNCSGYKQQLLPFHLLSLQDSTNKTSSRPPPSPFYDINNTSVKEQVPPDISITTTDDISSYSRPVFPINQNVRLQNFLQISLQERSSSWSGQFPGMRMVETTWIKIPHTFQVHSYKRPTICHYCKKLLKGLIRQGLQCLDCKYNCHRKCIEMIRSNCHGSVPMMYNMQLGIRDGESTKINFGGSMKDLRMFRSSYDSENVDNDKSLVVPTPNVDDSIVMTNSHHDRAQITPSAPLQANDIKNDDQNVSQSDDILNDSQNIPLMRIVMSKKQTKPYNAQVLKEGWMMHYTDRQCTRKKHYWRLDTKSIVLYKDDSSTRFYKEIPLSEILDIKYTSDHDLNETAHFLEIQTRKSTYYMTGDPTTDTRSEEIDVLATWAAAIKQALMPITSQTIMVKVQETITSDNEHDHEQQPQNMQQFNTSAEDEMGRLGIQLRDEQDFSQRYQIFIDEILGSGQFGTVYGGIHRKTGRHVAVKLINKTKFPNNKEAALRTEVEILSKVEHPGVVAFQEMLETTDRIFVVMEKLKGDMLEMILCNERGKLSERVTQFLVYQILIALRYLHNLNIVHCDLKPENILLVSDSDFPQIKLCDFGFARIIGERGFRRSVVGTPAYLAPEVLCNKGFNRSLDMWSVGVIVYVSLSGTFPFNEDEDINDQIQNADFMYPSNPWCEITTAAIDFINNLLQVKMSKRLTVLKALSHNWLQNYQLWSDLRCLEKEIAVRFLTHESDDARWTNYENELDLKPTYL